MMIMSSELEKGRNEVALLTPAWVETLSLIIAPNRPIILNPYDASVQLHSQAHGRRMIITRLLACTCRPCRA